MQGYIFATTLVALPLTLAVTQRAEALAELTERERLFRRNFTESMTGMVLLVLRGDRLEIVDANDTALQLLDDGRTPVMGRYLDRVLTGASTLRERLPGHEVRRPRRLARAARARTPPREPRQGGALAALQRRGTRPSRPSCSTSVPSTPRWPAPPPRSG